MARLSGIPFSALAFVGLGTWYYLEGQAYLEGAVMGTASSGSYTTALSLALACLASILLLRSGWFLLGKGNDRNSPRPAEAQAGDANGLVLFIARLAALTALAAVYIVALDALGFLAASLAVGCALLFLLGERRAWRLVLYPAAYTLAIWLLFTKLLMIQLPVSGLFS